MSEQEINQTQVGMSMVMIKIAKTLMASDEQAKEAVLASLRETRRILEGKNLREAENYLGFFLKALTDPAGLHHAEILGFPPQGSTS
jgi:hypothetical protein